jgi:hypothetical protein
VVRPPVPWILLLAGWGWACSRPASKAPGVRLVDEFADARIDSASEPEVVERLRKMLEDWHRFALSARLPTDGEAAAGMSSEQLERLRSLGYVQ